MNPIAGAPCLSFVWVTACIAADICHMPVCRTFASKGGHLWQWTLLNAASGKFSVETSVASPAKLVSFHASMLPWFHASMVDQAIFKPHVPCIHKSIGIGATAPLYPSDACACRLQTSACLSVLAFMLGKYLSVSRTLLIFCPAARM